MYPLHVCPQGLYNIIWMSDNVCRSCLCIYHKATYKLLEDMQLLWFKCSPQPFKPFSRLVFIKTMFSVPGGFIYYCTLDSSQQMHGWFKSILCISDRIFKQCVPLCHSIFTEHFQGHFHSFQFSRNSNGRGSCSKETITNYSVLIRSFQFQGLV